MSFTTSAAKGHIAKQCTPTREYVGRGIGTSVGAVCSVREYGSVIHPTIFMDYDPYEGRWIEDDWD